MPSSPKRDHAPRRLQGASPGDIPLGSFPEGAYRLEIKVTDKTNNKVIMQNAEFTVTAG